MVQIIVTPKDQRDFANAVEEMVADLRGLERRLETGMQQLGGTWKDARYRNFSRSVTTASVQLQIFYNRSHDYVEFLRTKAAAGDVFLRKR